MEGKNVIRTIVIIVGGVFLFFIPDLVGSAKQQELAHPTIKDEPRARALYKKMIETIRMAETLSYESKYREEDDGEKWEPWTYRVWMKKPNYFLVETTTKEGKNHGILVGDGQYAWSYWPNGRPWFSGEDRGEAYIKYQKTRFNVYMKEPAPDFELLSADGTKIKLSDYRGNVVWLSFWRTGYPPCREEIPYLEKLYSEHKNKGLVVLGFDFADDRQIALDFLSQHSVTFPNIVDTSDEAIKAGFIEYQARAAPVNYIIDREGKIAAGWLGNNEESTQGIDLLAKLGIKQID